jgi:TPR repeat protein
MAKAVEWYQKAAAQGDVTAQYNLGILYEKGIGVQKDNTQAAELFKKAARHGAAGPQFSLAACRP